MSILHIIYSWGAILGKKLTVSGSNMTHNAFYHINKVCIYGTHLFLKFSLEMLFVWTFNALDRDETPYLQNLDIVGP